MITIILIRHAESAMNTKKHLVGGRSSETPLSLLGEQQAVELGRLLRTQPQPNRVVSSPAVRAQKTAELSLARLQNVPEIELSAAIHEMSQGVFEGQLRDTVYTPEVLAHIDTQGRDFKLPGAGAESMNDVAKRLQEFIEAALQQASDGDTIYMYTHGIIISSYLATLFDWTQEQTVKQIRSLSNASCTILEFSSQATAPIVKELGVN